MTHPPEPSPTTSPTASRLAYEPALDGLRGISVLLVLLYHGGFSWMSGGFFGVEVFFVISGFLITSLLLAEHAESGRVSIGHFWSRRARRLFPALAAVLFAVALWAALWGTAEQVSQVRRDVPWAVFYVSNWGQIVGDIPYFTADPPLLRHLWSLGVEEQWYLIWPLIVIGLLRTPWRRAVKGSVVIAAGVASMAFTFWLELRSPTVLGGPPEVFRGVDRTNFMYLATPTRVSGLLLGAGSALLLGAGSVHPRRRTARVAVTDVVGVAALAVLAVASVRAVITDGAIYRWILPVVSVASLVAVLVAVRGGPSRVRALLAARPLVVTGLRSYGLYLWSWPIFVIVGATDGSVVRFLAALGVSVVVTEVSYRLLELPVRRSALGRVWRDRRRAVLAGASAGILLAGSLAVYYARSEEFDALAGDEVVSFDVDRALADDLTPDADAPGQDGPPDGESQPATPRGDTEAGPESAQGTEPSGAPSATSAPPSTAPPTAPPTTPAPGAAVPAPRPQANLVVLGDSQGDALVKNLPLGVDELFPTVVDGSIEGCGVWSSGAIRSTPEVWTDFAKCAGWQDRWAASAEGADVALVMLGAWDVFDLEDGGSLLPFASPEFDAAYTAQVHTGIDAVLATGTNVALLEVPCMRPIDVPLFGVVALRERGDDVRTAHVNELLQRVAASYGPDVRFVKGPDWCGDAGLSIDGDYRWDGVHLHPPGVRLVLETVAADLLRVAAS